MPRPKAPTRRHRLAVTIALGALAGCSSRYPELRTPLRESPPGRHSEPPPDPDLVWVAFKDADVPARARDGRPWHEPGSGAPDPFAVLFVNGAELLRTPVESGSRHPNWPDSPRGNFRFAPSDRLRVELREHGLVDRPICLRDLGAPREQWLEDRLIEVSCDAERDARVAIEWEPAHGRIGYGFFYELRAFDAFVTRVFQVSPAARAGVRAGDQIVTIDGKRPRAMRSVDIHDAFAKPRQAGLALRVLHQDGSSALVTLGEGWVYPLFSELGDLP